MSEEATEAKTFDAKITKMGDEIAGLTLKEAVDLADYMEDTYGIEPAAGGAVAEPTPPPPVPAAAGEMRRRRVKIFYVCVALCAVRWGLGGMCGV